MISHANGSAEWHREQRGIKTPEQQRIEQLEKELAECKRDAERYRWLRQADQLKAIQLTHYGFDALDSAIDSAIAAQGEGKC